MFLIFNLIIFTIYVNTHKTIHTIVAVIGIVVVGFGSVANLIRNGCILKIRYAIKVTILTDQSYCQK